MKDRSYDIHFENVWQDKGEDLISEIVDTWHAANILPSDVDARERARQVVFVARNHEKRIVGLTTAYLTFSHQLKNHVFAFRGMTVPQYRVPGLFLKLSVLTNRYLESIHHDMSPKPIGVLSETENVELQKVRDAVSITKMTFIGYSSRGNPIRVQYFKGAKF